LTKHGVLGLTFFLRRNSAIRTVGSVMGRDSEGRAEGPGLDYHGCHRRLPVAAPLWAVVRALTRRAVRARAGPGKGNLAPVVLGHRDFQVSVTVRLSLRVGVDLSMRLA
jgi:hypothetical protein